VKYNIYHTLSALFPNLITFARQKRGFNWEWECRIWNAASEGREVSRNSTCTLTISLEASYGGVRCQLSASVLACAGFGCHICDCQPVCGLWLSRLWLSVCVRALAVTFVTVSLCAGFGCHVRDCQPVCGLQLSRSWLSACVRASAVTFVTVSLCAGFGCHIRDCQPVCGLWLSRSWLSACVRASAVTYGTFSLHACMLVDF